MQRDLEATGRRWDEDDDPGAERRVLLWAMRAWVVCVRARALPALPVLDAFRRMGVPSAAALLDEALVAVARPALRPLSVHCPCCPDISGDERLLLDVAAAAQHGDREVGLSLLADLLDPTSARRALDSFTAFGSVVALAGLLLPPPDTFAPAFAGSAAPSRSLH